MPTAISVHLFRLHRPRPDSFLGGFIFVTATLSASLIPFLRQFPDLRGLTLGILPGVDHVVSSPVFCGRITLDFLFDMVGFFDSVQGVFY